VNRRVEFLNLWTAALLARLLDLFGMDAAVAGDVVTWHNHAQSFRVVEECTGVFGFWILAAFVAATPTRLGWRLLGIGAGSLVIFVANQLRLLGLVLIQTYWPSALAIAHDYLWQVVFVMVIAATFLAWLGRTDLEIEAVPR
jgi:archaeosortase B (VPXXXP-CTERM-specific)